LAAFEVITEGVRLRAFGIYTYHIADPKVFYSKVSD
jgi:membrane protease subunit (stomatin/prohibitin family)